MVDAALKGKLNSGEFIENKLFHVNVPTSCEGVPTEILSPVNTWKDKDKYQKTAEKLAMKFSKDFDKSYGQQNLDPNVISQCPGK
jgi:phosphoenolpyruvate carboxykinase (ATP)